MRYTVVRSIAQIVGTIWMPAVKAATQIELDGHALEGMKDDEGNYTRDSVERWLLLHKAGDFQSVDDFRVELEVGDETIEFGWQNDDSEHIFFDCMGDTDY